MSLHEIGSDGRAMWQSTRQAKGNLFLLRPHRFQQLRQRFSFAQPVNRAPQSSAGHAQQVLHSHERVLFGVLFKGRAFAHETEVVAAQNPHLI